MSIAQKLLQEISLFFALMVTFLIISLNVISMPLKGGVLEDPANEPKKDMRMLTAYPEEALKKSE